MHRKVCLNMTVFTVWMTLHWNRLCCAVPLIGDSQEASGHSIRGTVLLGLAKTLEVIQANTSATAGAPGAGYTG